MFEPKRRHARFCYSRMTAGWLGGWRGCRMVSVRYDRRVGLLRLAKGPASRKTLEVFLRTKQARDVDLDAVIVVLQTARFGA